MNNKTFAAGGALALAAAAAALTTMLGVEQDCDSLNAAPAAQGPRHTLALELAGNTESLAQEARAFAAVELKTSGEAAPEMPLTVRVVLVKDGRVHRPTTACLRETLILRPAEQDAHAYNSGSERTRQTMLGNMAERRAAQIGAVAQALADEVAATSFDGLAPEDARLSPLPVWSAAAEDDGAPADRRWISVLSPLHSNAGDCLDPASGAPGSPVPAAHDLVRDCVAAGQLPVADAAHVTVAFLQALATAADQRAAAAAAAEALCAHAASADCAPPRPADA